MMKSVRQFFSYNPNLFFVGTTALAGVSSGLTLAIATIFLLDRNLSFFEISIIWGIQLGTAALLEFPTGNFADLFGRRKIFALGIFLMGCGKLLFAVSYDFWLFGLGALFMGVGYAHTSGALSSWMVDSMTSLGKKEETSKAFASAAIASSLGGIGGGLFAGLVFKGELWVIFLLASIVYFIISFLVITCLEENYGDKTRGKRIGIDALKCLFNSSGLILLSALGILFLGSLSALTLVWQPAAVELGVPKLRLGLLFASCLAFEALGGLIYRQTAEKLDKRFFLFGCFLLLGIGFFLSWIYFDLISLFVMLGLFYIGYGIFFPFFMAWSNELIPSEVRASVVSLLAMISMGGSILLQVLIGHLIDRFGVPAALISGLLLSTLSVSVILGALVITRGKILEKVEENVEL